HLRTQSHSIEQARIKELDTFVNQASAFSILTKPSAFQYTIGQRDRLSFNDVKLMNRIYCSDRCRTSTKCHNGGYQHPNHCNICLCPAGFTGAHCEQIDSEKVCGSSRIKLSQNRITRLTSPNYPRGYKTPIFCAWLIETENSNDRILLKFTNLMDLYCDIRKMTCLDYVEIRNSTDLSNTGMRFCCMNRPEYQILSESNKMLVLYNSFYRYGQGFDITVDSVRS
uniref:CUB domain-containing protein n=1 Tax=Romanomermis culicivorax TaxID=13658 RepID=A0A915IMY3_ROMCU